MSAVNSRRAPGVLGSPVSAETLDALVSGVAHGERRALAGLHHSLAPEVLIAIRRSLPDPVESTCVLRATFVEVWRLARYHTTAGGVRDWVTGIASRRAAARARLLHDGVGRDPWQSGMVAAQDAHIELEFINLLHAYQSVAAPAWPRDDRPSETSVEETVLSAC